MASPHLSIRVNPETLERLDKASRRSGTTRSELAKRLIEEGLRMAAHPGIVFKPGAAGRRPALIGGPDVWEVVTVLRDFRREKDPVRRTAEWMSLEQTQVDTALAYYAAFESEVDHWIRRNGEEAAAAEAAWRRRQQLLAE